MKQIRTLCRMLIGFSILFMPLICMSSELNSFVTISIWYGISILTIIVHELLNKAISDNKRSYIIEFIRDTCKIPQLSQMTVVVVGIITIKGTFSGILCLLLIVLGVLLLSGYLYTYNNYDHPTENIKENNLS